MRVVEMDHVDGAVVKAGRAERMAEAVQTLEAALESVLPAAQSILAKLRQAGPHEIAVEFGVNLTVEAGAVIAKTAGGCHLKVTLHWRRAARGPALRAAGGDHPGRSGVGHGRAARRWSLTSAAKPTAGGSPDRGSS